MTHYGEEIIKFAKVEVAGSNPVSRSIKAHRPGQKPGLFYCADTDSCNTPRYQIHSSVALQEKFLYHISPICALSVP